MWISRKWKTTKVCFRTFPDLWRHPCTGFFCLILNLTYRSNETFFSRTLSFGAPGQVCPVRYSSSRSDKRTFIVLRTSVTGMVPGRPPGPSFRAQRPEIATRHSALRSSYCKFKMYIYISYMDTYIYIAIYRYADIYIYIYIRWKIDWWNR